MQETKERGFNPWVWKSSWRWKLQHTPVLLPVESHGQKNLVGYSPKSHKKSEATEWLSTQHSSDLYLQGGLFCLFVCMFFIAVVDFKAKFIELYLC